MATVNQETIAKALEQIRQAEQALDDVIATTAGSDTMRALTAVYSQLTTTATMLVQAQTIADDAIIGQVISTLKVQATALQNSEASIKQIITDADNAGKILGYIIQAVSLISSL